VLVAELADQGVLTESAHHWRLLEALHRRGGQPLGMLTDSDAVERTQRWLADACRAELADRLGPRQDLLPANPCDQWLLVALSWAQQLASRFQERTLLDALRHWCARYDPSAGQRLRTHILLLLAFEADGSESLGITTHQSFRTLREPAVLADGDPPTPLGPVPIMPRRRPGNRRCAYCGGTMTLDTMDRCWVCLLCGRSQDVAG
jgi:hypothetical protein